jgi:energy-coupling factor transport system permease protein
MMRSTWFVSGDSWLHRADARAKLALLVSAFVLLLVYQSLITLAGLGLVFIVMLWSAGLGWPQLRPALLPLLPVSLLMFVLRAVFYPAGSALASVGPIVLTDLGLAAGAVVAVRILALALVVLLWLATTTQRDVVRSLVWLGVPYSWGLAFSLALRFLPEMAGNFQSIEQAQRARGLLLEQRGWRHRLRHQQPIFIAMIVRSLRRSQELALALEARGFGAAGTTRTDLHPLRFKASDWPILLAIVGLLAAGLWAFFGLGLGHQPLQLLVR